MHAVTGSPRQVRIGTRRICTDDEQPTFWDRVEAGEWEPGTLRVLDEWLGPGSLFVDVGSWVGALSLYAASLGAEVVALEADPKALEQLRRNLAVNPELSRRITVVPRALATSPGPVRMGARRKAGNSMSSVLLGQGSSTSWTTDAITADELAAEMREGRIDLLKIDIEGGEYALLPTLQPLLHQSSALLLALHPDLLAESGDAEPAQTARRALEPFHGWDIARVGPEGPAPAALDDVAAAGPAEWLFVRPDSARCG